jgi:hypothetical protein
MWKRVLVLALVVTASVAGCRSEEKEKKHKKSSTPTDTSGQLEISLATEAMGAVPTIRTDSSGAIVNTPGALEVREGAGLLEDGDLPSPCAGITSDQDATLGSPMNNCSLRQLFAFECHWGAGEYSEPHCPQRIVDELGGNYDTMKYKFTSGTLIGMIAHAQMYLENNYPRGASSAPASCESSSCATCRKIVTPYIEEGCGASNTSAFCNTGKSKWDAASCDSCSSCMGFWFPELSGQQASSGTAIHDDNITFVSTTDVNEQTVTDGDGDRYVIPIPDFYNLFRRSEQGDDGSEISYQIWHKPSEDDPRIGNLNARKHSKMDAMDGDGQWDMSDIFQTYATVSSNREKGKILAFNQPGVNITGIDDNFGARTVLLVNFETRRFALKYNSTMVVLGKGGVDMSTSAGLEGYYYAQVVDGSGDQIWQACVDNTTQNVVADSNCAAETAFFTSPSGAAIASYLGMNTQEARDLAGFLSLFSDADPLPATAVPLPASESVKYFPDRIVVK